MADSKILNMHNSVSSCEIHIINVQERNCPFFLFNPQRRKTTSSFVFLFLRYFFITWLNAFSEANFPSKQGKREVRVLLLSLAWHLWNWFYF